MIYALVVVYNKRIQDSLTLQCLEEYADRIRVIVIDNSTKDYQNRYVCSQKGYEYDTEGTNIGLSKAYNRGLKYISHCAEDYVMVLDDDTSLTDAYMQEVFQRVEQGMADVLLPVVKSGKAIISPTNIRFRYGTKAIQSIDQIDKVRITAINTGMVVRASVYDLISYSEALFLDFIDHTFMTDVRSMGFSIEILDSVIQQSFSRDEVKNLESVLFRFRIFKKDLQVYCGNNRMFYLMTMGVFLVKHTLKYRTSAFLKACFEKTNCEKKCE